MTKVNSFFDSLVELKTASISLGETETKIQALSFEGLDIRLCFLSKVSGMEAVRLLQEKKFISTDFAEELRKRVMSLDLIERLSNIEDKPFWSDLSIISINSQISM